MKKVSIIVPIYNMEKYLRQCLESIQRQTLDEIEIVCINDGSTDQSLHILEECAKIGNNIKIIDQVNSGVSAARNNGIEAATGEYVAFMDPDDYYLDDKVLEDMYCCAKENNVKICGGSFSEDHGTWIRKEFLGIYTKYTFDEDKLMDYKEYQFDYGYHRFLYERKMLVNNNIYFPPYIRFQDPPFFVKAMVTAEKFYAMSRVTYCYRYGHQKLKWDQKRTLDVVNGFIDNLQISREYHLDELHRITVDRFIREYNKPISDNLNANSNELLERVLYANSLIDQTVIQQEEQKSILPILMASYKKYSGVDHAEDKRVEEILNSTTYKIGNSILYLPKKIKLLFMKNKRG